MNGKNKGNLQEKATMSSSKLPIHWCKRESQLIPFNATCLKIVARGDSRAARESGFCERACSEEQHCNKSNRNNFERKNNIPQWNKSNTKTNLLAISFIAGLQCVFRCDQKSCSEVISCEEASD